LNREWRPADDEPTTTRNTDWCCGRACCDQVSYVNDTRGGAKAVAVLAEARTYDE
jgi:hypothetical protein